jgi:hypothetical protein
LTSVMGGITIESEMKAKQDSCEPSPSIESQFTYMIQAKFGGDSMTASHLLEAADSQAKKDPEKEIFSIDLVRGKPAFPDTTTRLKFAPFDRSVTVEILETSGMASFKRVLSTSSISYVRRISRVGTSDGHDFIIENGSNEIRLNEREGTFAQR